MTKNGCSLRGPPAWHAPKKRSRLSGAWPGLQSEATAELRRAEEGRAGVSRDKAGCFSYPLPSLSKCWKAAQMCSSFSTLFICIVAASIRMGSERAQRSTGGTPKSVHGQWMAEHSSTSTRVLSERYNPNTAFNARERYPRPRTTTSTSGRSDKELVQQASEPPRILTCDELRVVNGAAVVHVSLGPAAAAAARARETESYACSCSCRCSCLLAHHTSWLVPGVSSKQKLPSLGLMAEAWLLRWQSREPGLGWEERRP